MKGYSKLKLPFGVGSSRNMLGLSLTFLGHETTKNILGHVTFSREAGGPPDFAHGGAIAYVLDEAMGSAAWNRGFQVVSESIQIFYRHLVPINTSLTFEAHLETTKEDRVFIRGTLFQFEDRPLAESEGWFHILDQEQTERFAKILRDSSPPH